MFFVTLGVGVVVAFVVTNPEENGSFVLWVPGILSGFNSLCS